MLREQSQFKNARTMIQVINCLEIRLTWLKRKIGSFLYDSMYFFVLASVNAFTNVLHKYVFIDDKNSLN